jgi:hypothetical protein
MSSSSTDQNQINKINQILEQSADALTCGPDCQTEKKSTDLKQKYLDAETNLVTAPIKLKSAKKDYIVYTQGSAAYNKEQGSEEKMRAVVLSKKMTTQFNDAIASTNSLTDIYSSLNSNYQNIEDLYNKYVKENVYLKKGINSTESDTVTNDRKTYYEIQENDRLKYWIIFFKWLYAITVIIFIIKMILGKSEYSLKIKIGILCLLILYPFVINKILLYLYTIIKRIFTLIYKNEYK